MKHLLFVVASVLTLGMQSIAEARPLDFTDRFIPFVVSESGVLSGSLETRFVPGGTALQLLPDLTSESASLVYGLFVPGDSETTVTVNGERIDLLPAPRNDGQVYMVDPRMLIEGKNSFRIDRSAAESWAGTAMFAVVDAAEQVHFDRHFGEFPEQIDGAMGTREVPVSTLQTQYDVLWYDCTWKPTMTVGITYMESGSEVTMGAKALVQNLQIIEVDFDLNPLNNGGSGMVIDHLDSGPGSPALPYIYVNDNTNPRLRITLPAPLAVGQEFKIRVGYHGTPNNIGHKEIFGRNAFYAEPQGSPVRPVIYTVSQPYGGRRWWPSKDHPSDKATTTIQKIIVPKPAGYTLTAVSNGKLTNTVDQGSTLMYVWENEYPIATYLMSMCISNYIYRGGTYTSQDGLKTMPVGHYIYPQHDGFEGNGYLGTLQVMNFFADMFGEYPFIDQKYVTAAWNITWAIEHQTATSMPGGSSAGVADGLTRRNVHELAHQWFGDKITMADWDHLWLNEGFATYCEALFDEHRFGRQDYHDLVNSWSVSDEYPIVSPNSDLFDGAIPYRKGAWVLHMLRNVMGDDKFFDGCRYYLNSGYTSALSQPNANFLDFQTAMETGGGLSPGALAPFFNQWLYSPNASYAGRPNFSFSAAYTSATKSSEIRIGQHQGLTNFQMTANVRFTDADANTTTVRVNTAPSGTTIQTVQLGDFVPVAAALDPDRWMLRNIRAHINTTSLPKAVTGVNYATSLVAQPSSGNFWSKLSGANWISVSSNGAVSGLPPAPGVYNFTVSISNNAYSQQATFEIVVEEGEPVPPVVINEVLSENSDTIPSSVDTNEFVELLNTAPTAVNIGDWQLVVVSSGGNPLSSVTLPGGTVLSPNDHYVIGNASVINAVFPGAVDQNVAWSDSLPDSGGLVLKNDLGQRVDSIAWRADRSFGSGSESGLLAAEGGTGRTLSFNMASTDRNVSLGRLPNGTDTNVNLLDFAIIPPSPGAANAGIALPFEDDFNSGAKAEWKPSFQDPVRTVTPATAGKPTVEAPAPAGGNVLEVFDSTGGGDVVFLPGSFNQLNVEGFLWIPPANAAPWSVGIGVGTRVESGWFSSTAGFGLEHGLYLEYQNGSGMQLKNNRIAASPNQARLIAANSLGVPGGGFSGFSAANLGVSVTLPQGTWQPFTLYFSAPQNRALARIGGEVLYDGMLPSALSNLSGGVTVGFREEHSGTPSPANREGTFVDNIKVTSVVAPDAGIEDYQLY